MIGTILRYFLTKLSKRRLPLIEGKLQLSGLKDTVEVIRDKWGIPHIYANNHYDLFYAQGFVHAQDRFWQMEIHRRLATGRLSEIFGEIAIDTDRATRTFGFARLGEEDWKNANKETIEVFQAYSDGINAFLRSPSSKLPVEFTLIRLKPEPWRPEDSMAYARLMFWKLSHISYGEVIRAKVIETVGEEHAAELDIFYKDNNPVSLPKGIEVNILSKDRTKFLDSGKGSNAWAIAGWRTTSGANFLCNDMHLQLMLPAIWYENHLCGGDYNVTGATTPGAPLVHVGHNDHIAWGMTLAYTDCEDLFIEKFNPDNTNQYEFQGEWLDADIIPELIKVKGKSEPIIENVFYTKHGPIISDIIGNSQKRVALNSIALRPTKTIYGWQSLNIAKSWDNFIVAIRLMDATHLNVAYADVNGNIGYWVSGKVPVRAKGKGLVPVPGWTGEYEWIGEVPFEEMPHALNPEQGYIVTCNNQIVPDNYPHFLGNLWMNGYRAQRIVEIFESQEKVSTEDFKKIHVDFKSIPGLEFVERLRGLESTEHDVQVILEHLQSWDGNLSPNSIAGAIYEVSRYFLVRHLLEPGLGTELTTSFMGQGFHPMLYDVHEHIGHDTVIMLKFLDNPNSWWIKQAGGREEVLLRSLKDAHGWLKKNLGTNVNSWEWGRLHRTEFPHAMALQKPLDKVFNRGPFPIGGDADTPCQTTFFPEDPYDVKVFAPTHRQIIDMSDLTKSLMIIPPGQSGHLGSHHYDDMIDLWIKGDYHPMLWTREQIESNSEGKLILFPKEVSTEKN
ncbi:MAG: penicillin acylase family protein [Candidatus Hodarchaeales archaeon]|jgi:penicillin amidase